MTDWVCISILSDGNSETLWVGRSAALAPPLSPTQQLRLRLLFFFFWAGFFNQQPGAGRGGITVRYQDLVMGSVSSGWREVIKVSGGLA